MLVSQLARAGMLVGQTARVGGQTAVVGGQVCWPVNQLGQVGPYVGRSNSSGR